MDRDPDDGDPDDRDRSPSNRDDDPDDRTDDDPDDRTDDDPDDRTDDETESHDERAWGSRGDEDDGAGGGNESDGGDPTDREDDLLRNVGIVTLVSIGLGLAAFGVGIIATLVLAVPLLLAGIPIMERIELAVVLETFALQGLGFGGVALAYLAYRGWPSNLLRLHLPSIRDVGWIVAGVVLLLGAQVAIGMVFLVLGLEPAEHVLQEAGIGNPEVFLLLIPIHLLLVGPAEELLFRGIIQGRFREYLGPAAAISITSVLFAVLHFGAFLGAELAQIVPSLTIILLLSLLLGAIYERTGNIVVPALIHGAFNATVSLIWYLDESGVLPEESATIVLDGVESVATVFTTLPV